MSEQEPQAGEEPEAPTEVSPPDQPPVAEAAEPTAAAAEAPPGAQAAGPRRLTRSRDDRVIAGVCGGLGEYLGIDPVLVRIAALVLVFAGGAGILLYLIGWIAMPEAEAAPWPEGATGEPPSVAHETEQRSGALVLGLVFVALGAFFLVDEIWPDFLAWKYIWPIALIAIGLAIVLRPRR